MLILSERLTKKDIEAWRDSEQIDAMRCKTKEYKSRLAKTRESIKEFVKSREDKRFYGGISFGKDSLVMATLMREVCPDMKIVNIRNIENFNPDSYKIEDILKESGLLSHDYEVCPYDYRFADDTYYKNGKPYKWFNILSDLKTKYGAHITGIRADESAKRERRIRVFGLETEHSFAPLAYMKVHDIFAFLYENNLPVHPVYAMTRGGEFDKYRLRVSAIGNPEGRGVGRLIWEKEYYGDILNRMGKTLWQREYES